MSILIFLIILSVLVMVHEAGHFLVAKLFKIRVLEFSLGMGPKLFGFQKGETLYALRLLPIGGMCMFDGEDGKVVGGGVGDEHCFNNANVWARIFTVAAGPICNFVLALIFSIIIVNFTYTDLPILKTVAQGGAAYEAGLRAGDEIISINGERVHLYREIQVISQLNADGDAYEIVAKRDGEKFTVNFAPSFDEEYERYFMGISGCEYANMQGVKSVKYGLYEVRYAARSTYKSLLMMIQGKVKSEEMSGIVGIANMVDETYDAAKPAGWANVLLTMMSLSTLLSVNLGIINLLPLPALDGGRLVFLAWEVVRGKPVPADKEGMVHAIGFIFFMILMVFLVFNDIKNIFF